MTFGDDDPADAYDVSSLPDPVQVARRLHEVRRFLDQLAGRDPGAWHHQPADHRDVAVAIVVAILDWLADEGHFD